MKSLYELNKVTKRGNTITFVQDEVLGRYIRVRKNRYRINPFFGLGMKHEYSVIDGIKKPTAYRCCQDEWFESEALFKNFLPLFELKFKSTVCLRRVVIWEFV